MTQKFYGAAPFAKAVVEAHKEGNPFNPLGCRGFGTIYTYSEAKGTGISKSALVGNQILATNAMIFVQTINEVLDGGGIVNHSSAKSLGFQISCSVTTGETLDAAKAIKSAPTEEATEDETSNEGGLQATHEDAESKEDASSTSEDNAEVQVTDEVEEPLEDSTTQSDDFGQVDWDYAESLVKKELDSYAKTFGVDLDRRKSKASMIETFKSEMLNEG